MSGRPPKPISERLAARVSKEGHDGCWLWTGTLSPYGYGVILNWAGKQLGTHRVAYELAFGAIPAGMCVCHHCDVPRCVNPEHLFLGTSADNVADKMAKGRQARGVTGGRTVLTPAQVLEIRQSKETKTALAAKFGVHRKTIYDICNGVIWQSV